MQHNDALSFTPSGVLHLIVCEAVKLCEKGTPRWLNSHSCTRHAQQCFTECDVQDFIKQAMHSVPAQRGTAAQLLQHPWIAKSEGGRAVEGATQRSSHSSPTLQPSQSALDAQERLSKQASHHKNSPVSSLWHQQMPTSIDGRLQGSGRKNSPVSLDDTRMPVAGSPLGIESKGNVRTGH